MVKKLTTKKHWLLWARAGWVFMLIFLYIIHTAHIGHSRTNKLYNGGCCAAGNNKNLFWLSLYRSLSYLCAVLCVSLKRTVAPHLLIFSCCGRRRRVENRKNGKTGRARTHVYSRAVDKLEYINMYVHIGELFEWNIVDIPKYVYARGMYYRCQKFIEYSEKTYKNFMLYPKHIILSYISLKFSGNKLNKGWIKVLIFLFPQVLKYTEMTYHYNLWWDFNYLTIYLIKSTIIW